MNIADKRGLKYFAPVQIYGNDEIQTLVNWNDHSRIFILDLHFLKFSSFVLFSKPLFRNCLDIQGIYHRSFDVTFLRIPNCLVYVSLSDLPFKSDNCFCASSIISRRAENRRRGYPAYLRFSKLQSKDT